MIAHRTEEISEGGSSADEIEMYKLLFHLHWFKNFGKKFGGEENGG